MGAVKFVAKGADVMVPGIAVGISLINGKDLIKMEKGKGVKYGRQ